MPLEWEDSPLKEKEGTTPFSDDEIAEDEPVVRARMLSFPPLKRKKVLPRTVDEVIEWGRGQIRKPTQSWFYRCQSFCRQAYGVKAWSGTAIGAWDRIPDAYRHHGGKPSDAPRGALLYYSGGKAGHVAIAIGKASSDKCLSNDYVRKGRIDVAPRTFPRWKIRYVGWSNWTPFGVLDLDK